MRHFVTALVGVSFAGFAVAGITAFVQGGLPTLLEGGLLDRQILNPTVPYVLCGCGPMGRHHQLVQLRALAARA